LLTAQLGRSNRATKHETLVDKGGKGSISITATQTQRYEISPAQNTVQQQIDPDSRQQTIKFCKQIFTGERFEISRFRGQINGDSVILLIDLIDLSWRL